MSVITRVPEPNIWHEICKEIAGQRPPFREEDTSSVLTDYKDYDPALHHPVFFGKMHERIESDADPFAEIDVAKSHPSCVGYSFTQKPPKSPSPPPPPPPNKDTCTAREYLEHYVLPVLLPALEAMLRQAKTEKCFERKRTKFNALDFITEYLYRRNPQYTDRGETDLWSIPFVQEWLKEHPRPPLPLSLIWTEEEAALIIQSYWRGYLVRRVPEIQELRQWQKEWQEENRGIQTRVSDFWDKQMPDWDKPTPTTSKTNMETEEDLPPAVQSPTPAAQSPTPAVQSPTPAAQSPTPAAQSPTPPQ
ncbi:IQ domain-containing protein K-like [Haliotis rufescens]|uniref:IQ domain-containing protein K-like n=1 Tax=Haliotis rufescens TaxID=6454 RepID=UPI00201FA778|nr:IQ domain-containing protein K-like [Haliotis rufescens]